VSFTEGETQRSAKQTPVPIIALTANAVVGMKEMFIEKGFNGFLSKPIDVSMLDAILDRWIPEGKKVIGNSASPLTTTNYQLTTTNSPLTIPGIDTQKGITLVGGKEGTYRKLLSLFCADAEQRMTLLGDSAEDVAALISQAHAIKGVTANLGAAEISAEAAQFEAACKAANTTYVTENLDRFIQHIAELVRHISVALKETA
jgi:HPt (histidine-containing phosphotransfer) domain-containing protein